MTKQVKTLQEYKDDFKVNTLKPKINKIFNMVGVTLTEEQSENLLGTMMSNYGKVLTEKEQLTLFKHEYKFRDKTILIEELTEFTMKAWIEENFK